MSFPVNSTGEKPRIGFLQKFRFDRDYKGWRARWRKTALTILFFIASLAGSGIESAFAADPGLKGETLFVERRCVHCHTVGRGRFVGPDLNGVFGRYAREKVVLWITDPSAIYKAEGSAPVNEGYPPMPQTGVSPDEAEVIADYLLFLEGAAPHSAAGGTVRGKVVNETLKTPAEGVEVTLGSFVGDRLLSSRSNKTDAEGKFSFEALEWAAAHKISIARGGVFYETDKMAFKPRQREIEVDLPIYETRTDDGAIGVELNHLIVEPSGAEVSVAEFVEFVNSGDTAVVSAGPDGKSATLRFGVPQGAVNLNFIHGARETDGGFGALPVLPGMKRTVFSYQIPFQSSIFGRAKAMFTKTLEYKTSSFVVIAPASANVMVEGLGEGKRVSGADGRIFSRWDGAGLEKGGKVKISVVLSGGKRPAWVLPLVIFAAVLTVAVARVLIARRKNSR